jgi:hypothetical protein
MKDRIEDRITELKAEFKEKRALIAKCEATVQELTPRMIGIDHAIKELEALLEEKDD